MTYRFIRSQGLPIVVAVLMAPTLPAASIKFTADADVPKPQIVVGNGTILVTEGTTTNLPDGYEVVNLAYTVTAKAVANFEIDWITQRAFTLSDASDLFVNINGNNQLSWNGGSLVFGVVGSIDNNVNGVTTFTDPPPGGNPLVGPKVNLPEKWNENGVKKDVAKGNHQLIMYTSIGWRPAAIGDFLTVDAKYVVSVSTTAPVPEPSSLVLASVGILGLIAFARRRIDPRRTLDQGPHSPGQPSGSPGS